MKCLVLAKYLIKNYVVNPILKGLKRKLAWFLLSICLIGAIAAFAALISSGTESKATQAGNHSLREALLRMGLNRELAISLFSSLLSVFVVALGVFGRSVITVTEEAEYEILLAQPVTMGDYFVARFMCDLAQGAVFNISMLGMALLVWEFSHSLAKALVFPLAVFVSQVYAEAFDRLLLVARISLGGRERYLKWGAAAYLAVGAAHSLLSRSPSPILRAPFELPVRAVVSCFAITPSLGSVALLLLASAAASVAMLYACVRIAQNLSPEAVKPLSMVVRESRAKKQAARRRLEFRNRDQAILLYALRMRVDLSHARWLAFCLAVSAVAGYLVRYVLAPKLGVGPGDLSFVVTIFTPMLIAYMAVIVAVATLSSDMAGMWVYRVYAIKLLPLARGLLARYTIYFSEAYLCMYAFNAVLTGRAVMLLGPLESLPWAVVMSAALLAALAYIASKRKVVKQAPSGLYMPEQVAFAAIIAIVMPMYMGSTAAFTLIVNMGLPAWILAVSAAFNLALSAGLAELFARGLARLMESRDLAT